MSFESSSSNESLTFVGNCNCYGQLVTGHRVVQFSLYTSLWKRVIAWERSRAASGYGIIWGDADRNKQGGI